MIYIISNGKTYSDHRLYFVSEEGVDIELWLSDLVGFEDDSGYKCFEQFLVAGIIDGDLKVPDGSGIDTITVQTLYDYLKDYNFLPILAPTNPKYRLNP